MSIFKGSMVAIATPMNLDGSLDFDSLDQLIEFHVDNKTDVIISVGTTGESATLDADGCLLVTPYYNKPTQEGLFQHYKRIADTVTIPQILYNVPGRTSVDMLPETVQRLSEHKNIIGIKEASGNKDRSMELMNLCSENIQIFTGDDKTSMSDIIDGFSGNISVTANIAPLEMHMMCKYAIEGNKEKAEEINSKIEILHDILFCESNPIPVKWCLNRMGLIKKGIRLPLTWMDNKYDESLNNALVKTGIINE